MTEEQEEKIHHNIKAMEKRYQNQWDTYMMADKSWCFK